MLLFCLRLKLKGIFMYYIKCINLNQCNLNSLFCMTRKLILFQRKLFLLFQKK